jgi:glycosyltransferase involved in cell wall biosynthesis
MQSFVIIIPCYNEAKRLQIPAFQNFIDSHNDVQFYFVNDGSIDDTEKVLKPLANSSERISILNLSKNKGKGEAVREGILRALQADVKYIGYLDADLSTSLEEFYNLYEIMIHQDADIVFGSRIKKADTQIERSFGRHLVGRTIATIIDKRLKLGYYDTQCGAKIFSSSILKEVANQPFLTRWFFDVELFMRLKKSKQKLNTLEIPLSSWHNVKDSKLNAFSFPLVFKEIYLLLTKY